MMNFNVEHGGRVVSHRGEGREQRGQQGERGDEDLSSSGTQEGEQKNREEIF